MGHDVGMGRLTPQDCSSSASKTSTQGARSGTRFNANSYASIRVWQSVVFFTVMDVFECLAQNPNSQASFIFSFIKLIESGRCCEASDVAVKGCGGGNDEDIDVVKKHSLQKTTNISSGLLMKNSSTIVTRIMFETMSGHTSLDLGNVAQKCSTHFDNINKYIYIYASVCVSVCVSVSVCQSVGVASKSV